MRRSSRRRGSPGGSSDSSGVRDPVDPYEHARDICLRQLTHSARTRSQLLTAMRRRGVEEVVAERVLERFEDIGLIDDVAFAQGWVQSRQVARGIGPKKIEYELRNRGIDDQTVAEAVEAIPSEQVEAAARALVDRRLASTADMPAQFRARKLASMLMRKGYSPGMAFDVVRAALASEGQEVPCDVDVPFDEYSA